MSRLAVYPGSFDPVTFGHIDLIERSVNIFDEIIIAVAANVGKKLMFSVEERVDMIKAVTKDIKGVKVESFDGLVTEYIEAKNTNILIRGLRMISDFEYELQMAITNRRLKKDIETLFLMPSEKYAFLSSSLIKEIAVLGADLSSFVPDAVAEKLKLSLKR